MNRISKKLAKAKQAVIKDIYDHVKKAVNNGKFSVVINYDGFEPAFISLVKDGVIASLNRKYPAMDFSIEVREVDNSVGVHWQVSNPKFE